MIPGGIRVSQSMLTSVDSSTDGSVATREAGQGGTSGMMALQSKHEIYFHLPVLKFHILKKKIDILNKVGCWRWRWKTSLSKMELMSKQGLRQSQHDRTLQVN